MSVRTAPLATLIALSSASLISAEKKLPDAKPVPRLQAIPLPGNAISIQQEGRELTRFHADNAAQRRTFWYPIRMRLSDASLTRMGHPHDPVGHSHHNSVWITHHDVDGVDFWGDHGKGKGQIHFKETRRLWDGDNRAGAETIHIWSADGVPDGMMLVETRRWEWVYLGVADGGILSIEIELAPPASREKTTLGDTPFGLIGVRMAKTIGVHDGGGRILNSEGAVNEKAIFRKPARWVDYSGRVDRGLRSGGITLMDHPSNPNHPAPFHVRDDGWMGACLSFEKPIEVTREKPLKVRYGLWVHEGVADQEEAEAVWKKFAAMPSPGSETVEK